ncbi:MAG: hypothetical protein AAB214_18520 [Fibrobacterota bacterium]
MANGIAKAELICDGEKITGIVSIDDAEVEHGVKQSTIEGGIWCEATSEYGVSVEYVIPTVSRFDFLKLKKSPGTLIIRYHGGKTRTYFGVQPIKESASKTDGKSAKVETWELFATDRKDS